VLPSHAQKHPENKIRENMEVGNMSKNLFIRADEMVSELQISKPYAYKLMREMNKELEKKGYMTIAGRVSRQFFEEKFYGLSQSKQEVTSNGGI
jgi:hypothetical protein